MTVGNVTVKIYRRQRRTTLGQWRTIYEVSDYVGGVRKLRGFTDASQARREAERLAASLSAGEATAASFRNADAASFGRAKELLKPTGASLELAAASFAEAYGMLKGNAIVEAAKFYPGAPQAHSAEIGCGHGCGAYRGQRSSWSFTQLHE